MIDIYKFCVSKKDHIILAHTDNLHHGTNNIWCSKTSIIQEKKTKRLWLHQVIEHEDSKSGDYNYMDQSNTSMWFTMKVLENISELNEYEIKIRINDACSVIGLEYTIWRDSMRDSMRDDPTNRYDVNNMFNINSLKIYSRSLKIKKILKRKREV